MHGIFLAYKPPFVTSNAFLTEFKRRFSCKKAGFSGILDPFAKGVLLIACGSYTKLMPHLDVSKKRYKATLWLGLKSASLDTENVQGVDLIPPFLESDVRNVVESFTGICRYTPPSFSAKKINGKRAYALSRKGESVSLPTSTMEIFDVTMLNYRHPFVSFDITVSKGGYIRSLGEMVASRLGVEGSLCSLERVSEGDFSFENCQSFIKTDSTYNSQRRRNDFCVVELDILKMLPYPHLNLPHFREWFYFGKTLQKDMIKLTDKGHFIVNFEDFFSIIRLEETDIKYSLNRIHKC